MTDLPKFALLGADDRTLTEQLQPSLELCNWGNLTPGSKKVIFQQLRNTGWAVDSSKEILRTIAYLNDEFLRQCPGKRLHAIKPERGARYEGGNEDERKEAAYADFEHILIKEVSDALVLRMLSKLASCYIDTQRYKYAAAAAPGSNIRDEQLAAAFDRFDMFANCLNHIFEQFAVNQVVTRNGFVPRQDEKITANIYKPTLQALSDPKWRTLNDDLAKAFHDYRDQNYAEAITKAHASVQRFLQMLVGEEGKNGRGEIGKLYQAAKKSDLIKTSHFSEQFVNLVQSSIVAERATNSTAKPKAKETTAGDALLTLNLVLVFLQHCLTTPT